MERNSAPQFWHDDHLYGYSGSSENGSELVCYEVASGKEKWREGGIITTPKGRALTGEVD